KVAGKTERLATAGLDVVTAAADWRTELLAVITDPNVAFILMLIGVYGLIFEFLNPGAVARGLIGSISLLVALYALNLLPINYAGAALVLLGIGLMVAEAHIGSFGVIGVGGIVAFVIGAIMMFPTGAPGFTLSLSVVGATPVATAALFLLVLTMLPRSPPRPARTPKGRLGRGPSSRARRGGWARRARRWRGTEKREECGSTGRFGVRALACRCSRGLASKSLTARASFSSLNRPDDSPPTTRRKTYAFPRNH